MMITPELESTIERYSAAIAAIENTIGTYAIVQATIVRDRTLKNALKSATGNALKSANSSKSQRNVEQHDRVSTAIQAKQVMAKKSVEAIVREMNAVLNADAINHNGESRSGRDAIVLFYIGMKKFRTLSILRPKK